MINFQLYDLDIVVVKKKIKNLYLRVCTPQGAVQVSAPMRMSLKMVQEFIGLKLTWIKQRQAKLATQVPAAPKKYIAGESHYFNGQCYVLKVIESEAVPKVFVAQTELVLQVRAQTDQASKGSMLDAWYQQQLLEKLRVLLPVWEEKVGVSVKQLKIRKMKTRWGSCSPLSQSIRINFELIKKPPACLEYILVHELVHLLEPSHNKRFFLLMDGFLPQWRMYQSQLNAFSLRMHKTKR